VEERVFMKIAILSCQNVKDDCRCAGEGCMRSFNNRLAAFDCYGQEDIVLVGYNSCAGCPTLYAYEKILKRVKPLVEFAKAEKVHFSSCMVKMCPFVQKYKKVIEETYPDVEVVLGTDAKPDEPLETMPKIFKRLLTDTSNDITEEFKKVMETALRMKNIENGLAGKAHE
jgi:predicted metal-binding protein